MPRDLEISPRPTGWLGRFGVVRVSVRVTGILYSTEGKAKIIPWRRLGYFREKVIEAHVHGSYDFHTVWKATLKLVEAKYR